MKRTGVVANRRLAADLGMAWPGEVIRVALADREEIFREGLTKLLNDQPHIRVVCQCRDGGEVVEKSRQEKPDVILLDSQISGKPLVDVLTEIARCLPDARTVVIAHPETPVRAMEMLKAGARACFERTISVPDLVRSIELVSTGRIIISPVLAGDFVDEITALKTSDVGQDRETLSSLSVRETEITKLISHGATNREIAGRLLISDGTVKVHVKNILRKLDLRNRQQLAVYAFMNHWISSIDSTEDYDRPWTALQSPEALSGQTEPSVSRGGMA